MRVIIKPGAILALGFLIALTLGGIAFLNSAGKSTSPEASVTQQTNSTNPSTSSPSAAKPAAPEAPGNLLKKANWNFYMEQEGRGISTELSGGDLPAKPAYRLETQSVGKNPWNVGFNNKLVGESFTANTPLRLTFHARSPKKALLTILLQKDAAPFPHCWKEYIRLTPEWKAYSFDFKSAEYTSGEAILALFVGSELGTIEVAGFRLERMP
jgi:hypothetical protein